MSAFQDFVNLELPRRITFLTVGITGYDGDPNDGGAPAILAGAPVGTEYQQETPAQVWKKTPSSTWEIIGSGTASGPSASTSEPITLQVDSTSGTDSAGPIVSQADADAAGPFATFQGAHDALPAIKAFDVQFDLSGEEIRPQPVLSGDRRYANTIEGIWLGRCIIQGAAYTNEPGLVGLSVTATSDTERPELQFSGAPFAGLTLNGRQCRINYGDGSDQVVLVMENEDSSLFIRSSIADLDDVPVSVDILDQSSVLSEFLTGDVLPLDSEGNPSIGLIENRIANSKREDMVGVVVFGDGVDRAPLLVQDVRLRYNHSGGSSEYAISSAGTTTELRRCFVDHSRMPGTMSRGFINGKGGGFYCRESGFFDSVKTSIATRYMLMDSGFTVLSASSFFQITGSPDLLSVDFGSFDMYSCLFDRCGAGNQPLISGSSMTGFFFAAKSGFATQGYQNRIRNPDTGVAPISVVGAPVPGIGIRFDFTEPTGARSIVSIPSTFADGNTTFSSSVFSPSSSLGMVVEGGNLPDYIVSFVGFARGVTIQASSSSAPQGDVSDIQGIALPSSPNPEITWVALAADGPYVDELGNLFQAF